MTISTTTLIRMTISVRVKRRVRMLNPPIPSLIFGSKARNLPIEWSSVKVDFSLAKKYKTRTESEKHSSLLQYISNYGCEKLSSTGA
jgi:hypothetical protein